MKRGPGAGATVSLRANRYAGDRRWDTGDMAEKMYFIVPTRANDNDARSGDETLHQSLRVWGRNLTQISGLDHGVGHPVFFGLWSTGGDERQGIWA